MENAYFSYFNYYYYPFSSSFSRITRKIVQPYVKFDRRYPLIYRKQSTMRIRVRRHIRVSRSHELDFYRLYWTCGTTKKSYVWVRMSENLYVYMYSYMYKYIKRESMVLMRSRTTNWCSWQSSRSELEWKKNNNKKKADA